MRKLGRVLAFAVLLSGTLSVQSSATPWGTGGWAGGGFPQDGLPGGLDGPGDSLVCPGSFGGSCPTPREQCHQDCDDAYDAEVFECFTGRRGFLASQRAACYASASLTMGYCYAGCRKLP